MPKGILKLLSHCIMLTLPLSPTAGLLQVAWKSCSGILAKIWALVISRARTQVRVRWGSVVPSVCLVCLCHVLWFASVFRSVVRKKLSPPLRLQSIWWCVFEFLLVPVISWGKQVLLPSFAELPSSGADIGRASALSCGLGLPCGSYNFWSFLLGVKFMRGFGDVLCCLLWTGACRKRCLRSWEVYLLQHFLLVAEH